MAVGRSRPSPLLCYPAAVMHPDDIETTADVTAWLGRIWLTLCAIAALLGALLLVLFLRAT
jgi:hypothetical protein